MKRSAQKLHHSMGLVPHGTEVNMLRTLFRQRAEAFLRGYRQAQKTRPRALKNECILCVARRGGRGIAASGGVRPYGALAVHRVGLAAISADTYGIPVTSGRDQGANLSRIGFPFGPP